MFRGWRFAFATLLFRAFDAYRHSAVGRRPRIYSFFLPIAGLSAVVGGTMPLAR